MSGFSPVNEDRIMITRDLASEHLEPDKFSLQPLLLLPDERITADEVTFLRLNDPAQSRLEQSRVFVHVVAIQKHLCF